MGFRTSRLSLSRQCTRNVHLGSHGAIYQSTNIDLFWRNVIRLSRDWTLTGGASRQHHPVRSCAQGGIPSVSRNVAAVFAGLNGVFAGNELQLNLRRDRLGGSAGSGNTFFFGHGGQLGGGFEAIASCASACNAPPLGDLYYDSPYWAANPQLQPELAHTVEAALQWSRASTVVRATLLQTTGTDLSGYGSMPEGRTEFQNIFRIRTPGRGGERAWRLARMGPRGEPDSAAAARPKRPRAPHPAAPRAQHRQRQPGV